MVQLIINSLLLGIGLAMDAFSVSIANGILESNMKKGRMFKIAGVYAVFQFLMPLIGWFLVTTLEGIFTSTSPLHLEKAEYAIYVILLCSSIDFKLIQSEKHIAFIIVKFLGKVTL